MATEEQSAAGAQHVQGYVKASTRLIADRTRENGWCGGGEHVVQRRWGLTALRAFRIVIDRFGTPIPNLTTTDQARCHYYKPHNSLTHNAHAHKRKMARANANAFANALASPGPG
eukprot:scaffold85708_cov33-Tisochrysis_lutea.AAC.1